MGEPRIVLVDVSAASRDVMVRRLSAQGYVVESAADPIRGAEMALSAPPHAVVADFWMPAISGIQLCRLLRTEPATSEVPVILRGEPDNVCARTEIFGPVAFAMPFADEAEAVAIANGTPYGLAHAVWTADGTRAERIAAAVEAGLVWLDCQLDFAPGIRYGGWHLSGMGGGVLAPDALLDYLRPKSVVRRAGMAVS